MASYEDVSVLMTQNTQKGASSFDSREGEQMQTVDGMLGIDHVDGGEFGSMKGAAGDLKRSARGEGDENGVERSSEGEHRGLEVKKKIRGVAVFLGLARQL